MTDTRCCKYCGTEFSKIPAFLNEGTFDEGYCDKLHRKAHEKQLIKEGKMQSIQEYIHTLDGDVGAIMKDTQYRDLAGERIWFPKDGRPYYDTALKKTFYSAKEKANYMKEKRLVMDGSSNPIGRWPIEAGDMRDKSYRKAHRMED